MVLAASSTTVNFIPTSGFWNTIFHQTWINVNLFGLLGPNGFTINLIGLIIVALVGLAATGITERLAGEKPGKNLLMPIFLTILGAYIFSALLSGRLPFEIIMEGIPLIAALLGAIVFGVFYVLIRKQTSGSARKATA
jgi:uncharacterized membrane protein YeaQ/YmgE (transglycosylase-associated protein family)